MSARRAIARAEKVLPGTPAPDGAPDPRWLAILVVGEYIESNPEEIWEFVVRWGVHEQEDLRTAIATCLLEHLLQFHFDLIFRRLSEATRRNRLLADTFSRCWKIGQAEWPSNAERFDKLSARCLKYRRVEKPRGGRRPTG
jgi:hypothetical protein